MLLWYVLLCFARVSDDVLTHLRVTKVPVGRNLIDVSLLSAEERAWVDAYHKETWEKVSPLLEGDARAKAWLHRECAPL
jgi:Xaa-Pro aminopeptidase